MADSQFTRLLQIDPSAYEGPSTFEGLGDFLGAVNQYNQQTKAEARYQDSLAKEEERYQDSLAAQNNAIALEQERHDDEVARGQTRHDEQKAFRDKQYNDTVAQQNLVNQNAEQDRKKADQQSALNLIIQNTTPGSEERLLAIKSGEFDLLNGITQSINVLEKSVTERKRIKDVFSGLGVAEDSTIAEIKDVLTIERGNLNEGETNYLMGLMKQRYVLEDNIKTSPEYVAAEASLKARDDTSFLPKAAGAQRVLNSVGIEKLTKVREEMARKMVLATTTYAPGAEKIWTSGLNIGKEIALPYIGGEAVERRTGEYLYEGTTIDVARSPVDDEGELTEEASVVATDIADIMTNGDSLESIEGVLEKSLNANQYIPDQEGLVSIVEEYAPKGELKGLQKVAQEGTVALPVTKDLAKAVNAGISTLKKSTQSLYQLSTPGTVASMSKDVFQEKYQGSSTEFKKTIKDMYNLYLRLDPSKGLRTTKFAGTGNQAMRTRIKRELQKLKKISGKGKWSPYKYDDEIVAILEDITFS